MREGTVIGGRYVLGGLLGSGGMGRVYRAHDQNLGREVALKVMEERYAGTPEFVERFEREVTSAASLDHPNVVRVFDSGKDESGPPYMAMELIGGGTLKDRIRARGPLPPREAAAIALQVAEALEAAHEAGIVHRDVKPENVLLTEDGQAKVADFGIAKATEATVVTHTSMILGTAPYLSPEQAQGQSVGPASDLYSLGVVLFEALTGRPPFEAGEDVSPLAVAMKHLNEPAPAARTTNPHVPEPLEEITLALMRKDPAERHASAAILADDLTAFLEGRPLPSRAAALVAGSPELAATGVLPRATRSPEPPSGRKRRRAIPVLAVTLAALLALAASPLGPQDPLALGTRLVSTGPASVDRPVIPEVRQAPLPPEPPEERATTPDPEPEPEPAPEPEPIPEPEPTPIDEAAPSDTASTASASAGASASASATAPAEPDAAEPETADPDTVEPDPAEPDASASASASATAAEPEPQSVPEPSPSSAAPSNSPMPAAPVTPEPPDVQQPPDVEPPDVEIPDF